MALSHISIPTRGHLIKNNVTAQVGHWCEHPRWPLPTTRSEPFCKDFGLVPLRIDHPAKLASKPILSRPSLTRCCGSRWVRHRKSCNNTCWASIWIFKMAASYHPLPALLQPVWASPANLVIWNLAIIVIYSKLASKPILICGPLTHRHSNRGAPHQK